MNFLTPTTFKVLKYFFADPHSEYHEREVIRKTGISKGSANRILRRLTEIALLNRSEKGRMVFYTLNSDDPFIKQMKILDNIWALRSATGMLKENARKIILFGSCAEGTDTSESDIDLFILSDKKINIMEHISDYNRISEKKISPIIVNIDEFIKMKKSDRPLFERIDRGIILWESP